MRDDYTRQLRSIHDDLLRMGSRVEHALANAMNALATWDTSLAQRVIAEDSYIDAARTALEENVLELLSTHQPVQAIDLRTPQRDDCDCQ